MIKMIKSLGQDTRGATAIEYGLIGALVVVAIIGGLGAFADAAIGMWDHVKTEIVG